MSPSGAIDQCPWSGVPSSAVQHAGESKRGRHSQSMEPVLETKAAVSASPIIAYSSSGVLTLTPAPSRCSCISTVSPREERADEERAGAGEAEHECVPVPVGEELPARR